LKVEVLRSVCADVAEDIFWYKEEDGPLDTILVPLAVVLEHAPIERMLEERFGESCGREKTWSTMPRWQFKMLHFLMKLDFFPSLFRRLVTPRINIGPAIILEDADARWAKELLELIEVPCEMELCYSIPTEIWEFSGTIPVRIWRDMPLPILFRYLLGKRIDARLTAAFWECPDDEGVEIYYDLEFLYSWHASEKSLPRRWLDGELCPEIKKNGIEL